MEGIMDFLKNNISWIFDGIGVAVLTFLFGFFVKEKVIKKNQNEGKDNNLQKNIDGDNKGNQELVNCYNAQPILVQGDYINGLTRNEATEVAIEVFKSNSYELSKSASDEALKRAEELINDFMENLYNTNPKFIDKLKEPGMQSAFINAQIQYAKTGDNVTKDMLVKALNERVSTPEKTLKQRILDETISCISKITIEQMNFLSLWYVILCRTESIGNKDGLKELLNNKFLKFYNKNVYTEQFFQYLYYSGCAKVLSEGSTIKPIEELIRNKYSGLFSNGFTEEEFKNNVDINMEIYNGMMIRCLNDIKLIQFNALNENVLKSRILELNVQEKEKQILSLNKNKQKSINEVKNELIELCPNIESLLDLWKNSREVKSLELTPIGITIAKLNYNRITGENIEI